MLHISQYVQFLLHGRSVYIYIYIIMKIDIKIWNNHLLEHFLWWAQKILDIDITKGVINIYLFIYLGSI
jgi:hypothetical protein